jgi:hypothetical protein
MTGVSCGKGTRLNFSHRHHLTLQPALDNGRIDAWLDISTCYNECCSGPGFLYIGSDINTDDGNTNSDSRDGETRSWFVLDYRI